MAAKRELGVRLNPFEQVLKRPDMYFGNCATVKGIVWIYDDELKRAVRKKVLYNTGLFNIIREIGSNAIDNVWRSQKNCPENPVKVIKITVDVSTGRITVWNDGYCIPCEREPYEYTNHKTNETITEVLYPIEVFFADMHASTNYDDTVVRKTSGQYGFGAKGANILSKEFEVEAANPDDRKLVSLAFSNNAKNKLLKESKFTSKKGYTQVSFIPDYARFKYPFASQPGMDTTLIQILKLYACEISTISNSSVKFTVMDGEELIDTETFKIPSLEKYVRLFYHDPQQSKLVYLKTEYGDECVVVENSDVTSEESDSLQHISFVNGICTRNGGIHVDKWQTAVIGTFVRTFNERKPKKKGVTPPKTTARQVFPFVTMFLRMEADKPKFDNQTKDKLIEVHDEHGNKVKYELCDAKKKNTDEWREEITLAVSKMMKWGFVKELDERLLARMEYTVKKEGAVQKKVFFGDSYMGANFAGVAGYAHECTLWPAEGKSAKTTVISGVSMTEKGQDYHGALALRGKFINVTKHTEKKVSGNKEVKMLIEVIGLRHVDYTDPENYKTLRYGKMCMATDQDDDGHHIKGLIINFIKSKYPTLIPTGYLSSLSTAVVILPLRASRNLAKQKLFFSNPDFQRWQQTASQEEKKKYAKTPIYIKGLGSIPGAQVAQFFLEPRCVEYELDEDGSEDMVSLCFGGEKESVAWRKKEMLRCMTSTFDVSGDVPIEEPEFFYEGRMSVNSFIQDQLMIYNRMTLSRAIPRIYDGFKDSQGRILYGMFVEDPKTPETVETLAGGIKKHSAYHHGADSLSDTIIKMMQGFVGSNNVPFFTNDGNSGTRLAGGDDASQPRYPATTIEDVTRKIFRKEDEPLLHKEYDGQRHVGYRFWIPIVPMLLVNGANGIGTGWSTSVPSHDLIEVVDRVEEFIDKSEDDPEYVTEYQRMLPSYRGFKGTVRHVYKGDKITGWETIGILEECNQQGFKGWWDIKEAPIGLWTDDLLLWMQYLETCKAPVGKPWKDREVKAISETRKYTSDNSLLIRFKPTKDFLPDINTTNNFSILKSKGSYSNMWAVDENNYPRLFETPEDILRVFCVKRLHYYNLRYEHILNKLEKSMMRAKNQYKFVEAIVGKKLSIHLPNAELDTLLSGKKWKFDRIHKKDEDETKPLHGYSYLLSITLWNMTVEKMESLQKEFEKHSGMYEDLNNKTSRDLWREDLLELRDAYAKFLHTRNDDPGKDMIAARGKRAPGVEGAKKAPARRRQASKKSVKTE